MSKAIKLNARSVLKAKLRDLLRSGSFAPDSTKNKETQPDEKGKK